MTKSLRRLIIAIGILSVLSGVYLAFTGAAFNAYFFGMFSGIVLVGSAFLLKAKEDTTQDDDTTH
jgi:uncharacterized membrane protein